MPTVAYHTLGCKVNQYDTQAMEELLSSSGFMTVPFPGPADIYLLNTCTVTGTGDKKSLQLARKLKREHPGCILVLCGCLAQIKGESLLDSGADLIVGTQFRGQIVQLLNQVLASGRPMSCVEPLPDSMPYEPLHVSGCQEHTRAVLKIQEGCRNSCSYCIIPAVRGPIRSRPLGDIASEAERLSVSGFKEVVLTGIHLSSYGKDFTPRSSLIDVLDLLEKTDGILRVRLGSLEPGIATDSFVSALSGFSKLCPQFHLALQSGSDSVLRRMRRQYLTNGYLSAVSRLRSVFPDAAITTDVLTGFPGETESEFMETCDFIRKVAFSRIHVFPFSPRPGTPAAVMPGQLSDAVKQSRARMLISVGNEVALCWNRRWIGRETVLLPEEKTDGCWEGYSPEYLRIRLDSGAVCTPGVPVRVRITSVSPRMIGGVVIE